MTTLFIDSTAASWMLYATCSSNPNSRQNESIESATGGMASSRLSKVIFKRLYLEGIGSCHFLSAATASASSGKSRKTLSMRVN